MIDIRSVAKQYIEEGWSVVPLTPGEKRATTSWIKKNYTEDVFNPGDNIALKCGAPSGGRVDIDLDCAEAIIAAKFIMPQTGHVHGRPSKPDSHYWFICPDIKTTQFTDIGKGPDGKTAMLVEIRSTGGYAIADERDLRVAVERLDCLSVGG
jgi:hypothetical protein